MVYIYRTACKSTGGHLTVGQLAPHGTPRQQVESGELQHLDPIELQQLESIEP
jgi:hypothetical protein